jgi:hypothetical protein
MTMNETVRRCLAVVALGLNLVACGGGGGGGGGGTTSISLDRRTLSFSAEADAPEPAPAVVTATFVGDGVIVGYPPGVTVPDWLNVTVESNANPASFRIGVVAPGSEPTTLSTTLRFVTGRLSASGDASDIKQVDLPVSYTIRPSTFSASTEPTSVSFRAVKDGLPPPSQTVQISLSDGVIETVEYGIDNGGGYSSRWLSADRSGGTDRAPVWQLTIVSTSEGPWSRSANLDFIVRRDNGSRKRVSLPVSYTVGQPLSVSPLALNYEYLQGSTTPPAPVVRSFRIEGDDLAWSASSDSPWLTPSPASGNGPQDVAFTLTHGGLQAGTHVGRISVANPGTGQSGGLDVTVQVRSPQLVLSTGSAAATVNAGTTTSTLPISTIGISDELGGARADLALNWRIISTQPEWMVLNASSGATSPAAQLRISIDATKLAALANGEYWHTLTFQYTDSSGKSQQRTLVYALTLNLPTPGTVAPYVAIAGRNDKFVLRGSGFTGMSRPTVRIGGAAVSSLSVISDTEALIVPSSLSAGRYPVQIENVSGAFRGSASLLVKAARDRPYAAFGVSSFATRLVFDNERETLYAASAEDQQIDRYRFDGGQWQTLSPLVVPHLQDIALSPDGEQLIAAAYNDIYQIDLDLEPLQVVRAASYHANDFVGEILFRIGLANDGTAFLSADSTCCTGNFNIARYSLGSTLITTMPYPIGDSESNVQSSADGSVVFLSGYYLHRYLAGSGSFEQISANVSPTAVNRDGSRLTNQGMIYDDHFNYLGRAAASYGHTIFGQRPDRLYTFRYRDSDSNLGLNVIVSDPTAPLGSGAIYPEIARVPVADDPRTGDASLYYAIASPSTVSADDRTFFFRGFEKLIIVPMPP